MKTKAAILYKLNSPLAIEEIEIPEPEKGQVLVKIFASGICRSQLNEIKGLKGPDNYLPHLLGHEGAGEVVEVGESVTKVKKGDYVVLSWIKGKGMDVPCAQYLTLRGRQINSGAIATFAQKSVVSENRLVKLSDKIAPSAAALLGCAIPTGAGIILHIVKPVQNSSLVIFGAGGIGTAAILAAKMKKVQTIIAVDVSKDKLDFALYVGATHTINFKEGKCTAAIRQIVSDGTDYAIEATGVKEAMEKAYEAVKDNGLVVVAGNLKHGEKISVDPLDLIKGKRIVGSWGGEADIDEDIPYFAKSYLAGDLKLDKLITRKFKLDQINKAFEMMDKGESLGRMIIEL